MNLSELIEKLEVIDNEHDGETLQVFIADHFCYEDSNRQVTGQNTETVSVMPEF